MVSFDLVSVATSGLTTGAAAGCTAFCFLYVAFILLLPIEINILALMILGFLTGFIVDIFYNSLSQQGDYTRPWSFDHQFAFIEQIEIAMCKLIIGANSKGRAAVII